MNDTIFALSSGAPPAAIGVIRISGPQAGATLADFCGRDVTPRRAILAQLRGAAGGLLDQALVLWLPGPDSATGEDLVEFHCHGGRAVIAAVEAELAARAGLRRAEPGEFTRRAFANGRIDLAEAEGLADLLSAETELQRSAAMAMAGGQFSQEVEDWRSQLLQLSAAVEAALDFSDEDDVAEMPADFGQSLRALADELASWLERPRAERLGEGYRVVLAGPPNAGKSTLFNALVESEAAITSPIAGTTRDVIERSVAIDGIPFTFVDTAGLREQGSDAIEAIGVDRAREQLKRADLVLWLGPDAEEPKGSWPIEAQVDNPAHLVKQAPRFRVSAVTGENLDALKRALVEEARKALPKPGEAALNARQHALIDEARREILDAGRVQDPLIIAENLRRARIAFDRLVGRATTEDMLDALFGRFCIGK
ncbi:tRNA uridine-5-carboxymethylaminomethyl(34) synthesis GTPase MnmE [Altererythrobacter arenosus]|uniref:tRNA modification GTPase MnmE n=1 Tax=Altererythrobacter arenosus TaxID=3032592 RepID=A0ABY8FZ44_9SPHN|nr:tRNA uridine-5-carboxymethylaminomethyl(34) synthesis GTPase MnmE [Altererythrobacter sp. CAU 1644]WFL78661.1 tRNA uridine-5-carboxymethylaminomethyl(34) synthesis GTPase MnmE [Altererythrobacter sp. CAU 1644]